MKKTNTQVDTEQYRASRADNGRRRAMPTAESNDNNQLREKPQSSSRGNYSLLLGVATCLLLLMGQPHPVLAETDQDFPGVESAANAEPDPFQPLRNAWQQGRDTDRPVMLVLGARWCDRCVLLERYMTDTSLKQRLDSQFVVMSLDVGEPDSMISLADGEQRLPVIVLLDSSTDFEHLLASDSLMTFLPEPYEPLYDWLENILFYTEQSLALR